MRAVDACATARCGECAQKGPERCLTRETPTIFSASVRARGSCDGRKGVRPLGPRVPGSKRTGLRRRLEGHGVFERLSCTRGPDGRQVLRRAGKFSGEQTRGAVRSMASGSPKLQVRIACLHIAPPGAVRACGWAMAFLSGHDIPGLFYSFLGGGDMPARPWRADRTLVHAAQRG